MNRHDITHYRLLNQEIARAQLTTPTALSKAEELGVASAAERYGQFMGMPVSLA